MPLSRPVSVKEYKSIASDLFDLAAAMGFPFDDSKKNASDFMYLPCRGENPDASFFYHFKDEGRYPLDVDEWLDGTGTLVDLCANDCFTREMAEGGQIVA